MLFDGAKVKSALDVESRRGMDIKKGRASQSDLSSNQLKQTTIYLYEAGVSPPDLAYKTPLTGECSRGRLFRLIFVDF